RLTPKSRRFLFAILRQSAFALQGPRLPGGRFYSGGNSSGMVTITIPARPTFGPTWDAHGRPDDVRRRFWENVAKGLGYDAGRPERSAAVAMQSSGGSELAL